MKTKELRQKTAAELEKIIQEKREKLGSLNFDLAGGKVKNVKEIRESRKDIARILTLIKENEGKTEGAKNQ